MNTLLRRRMMMAMAIKGRSDDVYFKSGIITVEKDISSLDTEGIWDEIELFDLGITDLPETYGIMLQRITQSAPAISGTVATAYNSILEAYEDNKVPGNFELFRVFRNVMLMNTSGLIQMSNGLVYLKDGVLWQPRYNTEWHYNTGEEYFWCVYETPKAF